MEKINDRLFAKRKAVLSEVRIMAIDTTGLYKDIMEHLSRRMMFHEELGPPPICSIGAMIANLRQRDNPFHWVGGNAEDLGLNLTFVAPSGLAKSHSMKQFLGRRFGICPLHSVFTGKITEAGFVGTIKEDSPVFGLAFEYREGIVAFNEISNLFMTQQQDHSTELINQVMEALTERQIHKRLASGAIHYDTWVTIWGGIQPARFDFSQGLGRRFCFVARSWTQKDLDSLKDLRLDRSEKTAIDETEVRDLRDRILQCREKFAPKEVQWQGDILKEIKTMCDSHLQMQMVERVLIGKETLDQYDLDVLTIQDTQENKDIISMMLSMQKMVAEGSDISLLINVLQDSPTRTLSISQLWDRFRIFNYNLGGLQELLTSARKLRVVEIRTIDNQQCVILRKNVRER